NLRPVDVKKLEIFFKEQILTENPKATMITFLRKKFQKKNVILLEKIKEILEEFNTQGFRVTLRHLYYQLVSLCLYQKIFYH
ncbi:hypothetical protein LCGC14_2210050, partial [marine sediment metagenome]